MEILLENVRSFAKPQAIPITPLTLVVGENSSGKTSFLAMLARVADFSFLTIRPSFSQSPFDLGNYESIATRRGSGNATSFSVGLSVAEREPNNLTVQASYRNRSGQPELARLRIKNHEGDLAVSISPQGVEGSFVAPSLAAPVPLNLTKIGSGFPVGIPLASAFGLLNELLFPAQPLTPQTLEPRNTITNWLFSASNQLSQAVRPAIAIAPVRTQPRRTYDEISGVFRPTGDHIPFVLAELWQRDESEKRELVSALETFGQDSGLYDKINVKRLGRHPGDPFQIMVSVAGPPANLADVGYGVSQSLPIIVQSLGRYSTLASAPSTTRGPSSPPCSGSTWYSLCSIRCCRR